MVKEDTNIINTNKQKNEKGIDNSVNYKKEITKTWLTGQHSCTLIIPKSLAKSHGLDEPSHVVVESVSDGILIRRLDF